MFGKFVFGTVVCLAISQACHARPEGPHDQNENEDQNRGVALTPCKENLKQLALGVFNLFKLCLFGLSDIFYGMSCAVECAFRGNFKECSKEVLFETYENLKPFVSTSVENLRFVALKIYESAKTCFAKKSIGNIDPFLLSFANL